MIGIGYDIGTRFVKACLVEDENMLGFSIQEAGIGISESIEAARNSALRMAGIKKRKIKKIAATGFGGNMVKKAHKRATIESCLAKAGGLLNEKVRTVIDIGGLFIHVVTIGNDGRIDDFCKNEICAAGSGKFLELVSSAVELPVSSISESALKSSTPYELGSSCAVFAESEVISQVNSGRNSNDIIAGVIASIAAKVATLTNRIDAKEKIAIAGGVSKIEAFRNILANVLKKEIVPLSIDYQIVTAYGAAMLAVEKSADKPKRRLFA